MKIPVSRRKQSLLALAALTAAVLAPFATATDAPTSSPTTSAAGVQARAADAFLASQGVGTHFTYGGEYANKAMIEQRILESGIRRVRASWAPGDVANRDLAVRLGQRGVKIMFWTGQVGSDISRVRQAIKETNALAPGTIDAIEGPNEQDTHTGLRAFVQHYSQELRADPATAGLRIYGPSMANVGSPDPYNALGDISQWVDAANVHNYPGGRMMSDPYIDSMYQFTRVNVGTSGALMASELGYSNDLTATRQLHPAVPRDVSAVLLPRIYLEHFRRGLTETYLYELVNQSGEVEWERDFGLLNSDFTPKPAFTAIKNMNTLLADPGPAFTPGRLDFTLSGQSPETRTLLLQKRDGTFWLAVWQQSEMWDRATKQYTNIADIPVTLNLPTSSQLATFRPVSSTAATSTSTGSSLRVMSGVSPTLVKITTLNSSSPSPMPSATTSPAPSPAPAGTLRVNSGGGAFTDSTGQAWSADQHFTGGSVHTSTTTSLPELARTARFGSYTYSVPVAPGSYQLRLHTTETYWDAPNQRVFHASAEGRRVFSDLDIFAVAGKNVAVVRESVVQVDDGTLDLSLESLVNYATLDGFELIPQTTTSPAPTTSPSPSPSETTSPSPSPAPTTSPSPTLSPSPAPSPTTAPWALRVNAGGPALTDQLGRSWVADQGFSGGSTYTASATVSGPVPAVSRDSRFGTLTYQLPVPAAGSYQVRLLMTETYWSARKKRVFSASAEGVGLTSRLDLFATVGKNRTHVVEAPITVTDGRATITLTSHTDNATLDGIELIRR